MPRNESTTKTAETKSADDKDVSAEAVARPTAKSAEEGNRIQVSSAEFVKAWQSSKSAKDAGAKFNRSSGWANGRARKLRSLGVKLKSMPRSVGGGAKLDPDALNDLIEDLEVPEDEKIEASTSEEESETEAGTEAEEAGTEEE